MSEPSSTALISVIIPIGPSLVDFSKLKETLSLNKNLPNAEFILVIDSPNLDYFNLISQMASYIQMPNCRCIKVNFANPGETRNSGLDISSGKWIQFWDSDDVGDLNPIINFLEVNDSDLLVQQYKLVNIESNDIASSNTKDIFDLVSNPGIWRIAIRRSFMNGARFPALAMAEDQVFIFRLLTMNPKIEFDTSCTYSYFIGSETQLTSQSGKMRDLPESMKLISATDCEKSRTSDFVQLLFLEKILMTTIKHAEAKIIFKSLRVFIEYFISNFSLPFLIKFVKSSAWLVRDFVS